MLVMIAGPYSAASEEGRQENLDRLNAAAFDVLKRGHIPVVGMNAALPIVGGSGGEDEYEAIMRISLALAERCDAVLMIAESPGANREREVIAAMGRPVYHDVEELPVLQQ
jgi:hypothetical protein